MANESADERAARGEAILRAENMDFWALATSAVELEKTDDGWLVTERRKIDLSELN